MISLQSFLFKPEVYTALGMSPAALYERQRALVRLGLLPKPRSRGRNSGGATASPETVGLILLSILVTDNLSDVDESLAGWVGMRAIETKLSGPKVGKCHITGQPTLHQAIAWLLSKDERSGFEIEINRKNQTAEIRDFSGEFLPSVFGKWKARNGVEIIARYADTFSLGQWLEMYSEGNGDGNGP